MRWAEGVRGVRREREPVLVVRRIGEGVGEGEVDVDGEVDREGEGGRRVMVVG